MVHSGVNTLSSYLTSSAGIEARMMSHVPPRHSPAAGITIGSFRWNLSEIAPRIIVLYSMGITIAIFEYIIHLKIQKKACYSTSQNTAKKI